MSQLPFFTWHNILCAAVGSAVGAALGVRPGFRCAVRRVFTRPRCHQTQQYAFRTATPCAFGASSAFRWNVSVEKKFGLLLRCANSAFAVRGAVNFTRGTVFFTRAERAAVFVIVPQQMAALNFGNSFGVKLFVKIYRKVTSNIKFKKYKIVNKRSTNSLCTFLTFQAVIYKLISIIIFNAVICFE